jgi:hypothetical protein
MLNNGYPGLGTAWEEAKFRRICNRSWRRGFGYTLAGQGSTHSGLLLGKMGLKNFWSVGPHGGAFFRDRSHTKRNILNFGYDVRAKHIRQGA